MKEKTAGQVAWRLYGALMYVCIKHDINPYDEPSAVEAFKDFCHLIGVKESQWEFVHAVTSNFVKEMANG